MSIVRGGSIAAFAAAVVLTLAACSDSGTSSQSAATKALVLYASHPTAMVDH